MKQKQLLDQMRDILRIKHSSIRTERSYIAWAKRYILFHGKRHPKDIDYAMNHIPVRSGKGNKDRATLLPQSLS